MIAALATILAVFQNAALDAQGASDAPVIHVTRDNTVIDRTCTLVIDPTVVIDDTDGNGVIHIAADNITVSFAEGSRLVAGEFVGRWNALTGSGIRVDGRKNVTLKDPRISGCKVAIWATSADGLAVEGADLSDNFRQRLGSKPWAEDSADWLWPHENDKREWATNYGAALLVERSNGVTIHNVTVRRGQNGIMLDQVNDSKVYDNDCSFLSGWGLAMWRSSRNTISRNAFDFCVRGHSEGVYNRGQDSAGILCFEQCSNNTFAENSCTHSGDGFFGFAGKEALGEHTPSDPNFKYEGAGCNFNEFVGNDLSYAPAHGLEMTFSFGNRVHRNRFIENNICGIWGGYSQETLIDENVFSGNGLPGRVEGGAINIEHGYRNTITSNEFARNSIGVSLWSDDDGNLLKTPWALANHRGSLENSIRENRFDANTLDIRVRESQQTGIVGNTNAAGKPPQVDAEAGSNVVGHEVPSVHKRSGDGEWAQINSAPIGMRRPVGNRRALAGRANIIMDEWGPWDHSTPMVREGQRTSRGVIYEVRGTSPALYAENFLTGEKEYWPATPTALEPLKLTITGGGGYTEYTYRLVDGNWSKELRSSIVQAEWKATFFNNLADPRTDERTWRAAATAAEAVTITLPAIDLSFGYNGPARTVRLLNPDAAKPLTDARFKPNQFGVVATATIHLPAGQWKLVVESDDGVRLTADGKTVIENWSLHGPARDEAVLTLAEARDVPLELAYFQLEGFAVLRLGIERAAATPE